MKNFYKEKMEFHFKEYQLSVDSIDYAKQFEVDSIFGSNRIASVKEFEKCLIPEDKEKFNLLIKEKGLWDAYSMLCSSRLKSHIIKGEITDKDICDCIERVNDFRFSLRKRKDVEE